MNAKLLDSEGEWTCYADLRHEQYGPDRVESFAAAYCRISNPHLTFKIYGGATSNRFELTLLTSCCGETCRPADRRWACVECNEVLPWPYDVDRFISLAVGSKNLRCALLLHKLESLCSMGTNPLQASLSALDLTALLDRVSADLIRQED